ncbi:(Fe-S)-binding protein [Elizabethkingia sp. JS20170427COW]|uniref:(Fe-S)-binding protein n=1 Tax=Elizabethkingia sp. JS20170427COW TaxID=2583851 RepID=UPI0011100AD3|nr:(Fe-S)-binding protein [Elizabethkingia sp. JS20170427COW]QCX53905.1 (Fe-S)-binding protein [Elizabethkingia sp. JS20170427COW]
MKVGLFIPCYVDLFYPNVGIATLSLLEKQGVKAEYPTQQTCCGQPMANSGYEHLTYGCDHNFIQNFKNYDYIVAPSGSCVLHVKEHLKGETPQEEALAQYIKTHIYELVEFLTDVLKVKSIQASFPHKVGFHQSCHALRGLRLASMSERTEPSFSKPHQLLAQVKDLELTPINRPDECCGFGGTFCVQEEAVSVKMGKDKVKDHESNGAEYISGCDMSCLMHLDGILKRNNSPMKIIHIAEILNQENTLS